MRFDLPGGPPALTQAVDQFVRRVFSFPIRLWRVATASLPAASSDNAGGLAWDTTSSIITWSNGSAWVQPSLSSHVHAAATVTLAPAGGLAADDVQEALEELDSEKAPKANPTFTGTVTSAAISASGNVTTTAELRADVASGSGPMVRLMQEGATRGYASIDPTGASFFYNILNASGLHRFQINSVAALTIGTTGTSVAGTLSTTGNIIVAADGATLGGVRLERGTVNGFLAIYSTASVRQGYVGFLSGGRLQLVAEGAGSGWDARAAADFRVLINGTVRITTDLNGLSIVGRTTTTTIYQVNGTQVVGARKTGWAVASGTATRTTFDTATVTTAQLAERVKALIDDLHGTAGHGLIGT